MHARHLYEFFQCFDREASSKLYIYSALKDSSYPISLTTLSSYLKITQKTLYKYLHGLNQDMLAYSNGATALSWDNQQLTLITNGEASDDLLNHLLLTTETYPIWESIVFESKQKVFQLAQKNHVSEATICRKLTLFRKFVANYDLQIERQIHCLHGDEIQIRGFLSFHFWSLFRGNYWPFLVSKQACLQICLFVEHFFSITLTDSIRQKIAYAIAVWLMRQNLGHPVNLTYEQRQLINNPIFTRFFTEFTHHFKQVYFKEELAYLFLFLLTEDYFYQNSQFQTEWISIQNAQQTILGQSVHHLHTQPSEITKLFGKQLPTLSTGYLWSTHLFCLLFKNFHAEQAAVSFFNSQQELVHLKHKIQQFIKKLQQNTQNPVFLEHYFLCYRYLIFFSLAGQRTFFEETITLLLVTDLTKFEEAFLIQELETYFSKQFKLHFLLVPSSSVDLIISTKKECLQEKSIPKRLYVNQDVSLEDYHRLKNELTAILKEKNASKDPLL